MQCAEVQKILHEVREQIQRGGGGAIGLSTNFKIEVTESDIGGHGLTELLQKSAGCSPTVQRVVIGLKAPGGVAVPIETLLLTFIHELAHTVTELAEINPKLVPKKIMRLQGGGGGGSSSSVFLHHSTGFYSNYATLLKIAEKEGILVLPSVPGKLSAKNLLFLDSIDPADSATGFLTGVSPKYSAPRSQLRLLLCDLSGTKKTFLIDVVSVTVDLLLKTASAKFNRRGKKLFTSFHIYLDGKKAESLSNDSPITDSDLRATLSAGSAAREISLLFQSSC
eukprot:TRINITY_DN20200_c0_g1_i1.p1 TRINITY_DN20200_c0_g1~~TRINITY_DN20200_c0_g1_i1.p1  ORF type:complete len:280 (+),score=59.73 TRINITY_DN20200_c0_g1_i1:43-882(+)